MKKLTLCISTILFYLISAGQQTVELEENTPFESNGLQYGFTITNEQSKEVKGEDFDRYEINLYVTNKSGCMKLLPFTNTSGSGSRDDIALAVFNCKNATGKRLTAKSGKVNAKPLFSQVKVPDGSKYKFVNAQIGYAIKNGQSFTTRIIVIVPKGEKPKINCTMTYFSELN
jgi:hypothetical protein